MKNARKWGESPYRVVVVHGGPGMPGSVAPIARELSRNYGVLEPFQTKDSVDEQVEELAEILKEHTTLPVVLAGHSWGAILSYIAAGRYPELARKLILISMPALRRDDRPEYTPIWLERLPEEEREEFVKLQDFVWGRQKVDKSEAMVKLFRMMAKADSYDLAQDKDETLEYQYETNLAVGLEYHQILRTTKLKDIAAEIRCPVVAIHGDYDLRPAGVIERSLSPRISDFKMILLDKCGHYPWLERYARDEFFKVLNEEVKHGLTGSE